MIWFTEHFAIAFEIGRINLYFFFFFEKIVYFIFCGFQYQQPIMSQSKQYIRPQQKAPAVGLLYSSHKYSTPRPNVQSGFLYKTHHQSYKPYQSSQVAHKQPSAQPSYNSVKVRNFKL